MTEVHITPYLHVECWQLQILLRGFLSGTVWNGRGFLSGTGGVCCSKHQNSPQMHVTIRQMGTLLWEKCVKPAPGRKTTPGSATESSIWCGICGCLGQGSDIEILH